jgi:hypothetical protein
MRILEILLKPILLLGKVVGIGFAFAVVIIMWMLLGGPNNPLL